MKVVVELGRTVPDSESRAKQTCTSIFALSFVVLTRLLMTIEPPARVAFPELLQSPRYVGRPDEPDNWTREKYIPQIGQNRTSVLKTF